jgi:hypothetical protein
MYHRRLATWALTIMIPVNASTPRVAPRMKRTQIFGRPTGIRMTPTTRAKTRTRKTCLGHHQSPKTNDLSDQLSLQAALDLASSTARVRNPSAESFTRFRSCSS